MNQLKKITYNCRKATMLIEKKQVASLGILEQMELRYHLAGCSVCRRFQQQSILITNKLQGLFASRADGSGTLDEHFKTSLKNIIEKAQEQKKG